MKLDGRELAEKIYLSLLTRVEALQKREIIPHLVVILVGQDPASVAYITQKQKAGERIGAKVTILQYEESITTKELEEKITLLNADPFVNGILIQRPLPKHIDADKLTMITDPQKDVDGFHPDSPFTLPLPLAVVKILEEIHKKDDSSTQFLSWLKTKNIVLLGKGEAGGKPILEYLNKLHIQPTLVDSKTALAHEKIKEGDIIISAVGKKIIHPTILKSGVILLGVGLFKGPTGKLQGDYDEEEIKSIASFYTSTPGGVGPVNVAMLMENLLTATETQVDKRLAS